MILSFNYPLDYFRPQEVDEEVEDETERKRNDDPRARGPVRGGYGRK